MENELRQRLLNAKTIRDVNVSDCDLAGENIENLVANDIVLVNVKLRGANIQGIQWRNCHLNQVDLDHVLASKTVMRLCDFEYVTARNALFSNAVLENCTAQGCDFGQAKFTNSSLTDSDFSRASFSGAYMVDVDASFCNMRGADFRLATLTRINFQDADLRGADFTGARLDKVDFHGADITGALFDPDFKVEGGTSQSDGSELGGLVSAVGPIVENLLKTAASSGLIDEAKASAELEEVMAAFGNHKSALKTDSAFDEQISKVLGQAAEVGIGPLLDALKQDGGEPPLAVKKMIEGLMGDLEMGDGATTEDLFSKLSAKLMKKRVKH